MKNMIIIIDLHCDASLPPGAFDFGGGNKYSKNLLSLLLSKNIPFIYFTHRRMEVLEQSCQLGPEAFFIRLNLVNLSVNTHVEFQSYNANVISAIQSELAKHKDYYFRFFRGNGGLKTSTTPVFIPIRRHSTFG